MALLHALLLWSASSAALEATACDPEAATAAACFVGGDEMPCPGLPGGGKRCIIDIGATTNSSRKCCGLCSELAGCNVWTLRGPTCHLRTSWQHSRPVAGPCTTGVLSGPLPSLPALPNSSGTATLRINAANVTAKMAVKGGMMGCHTDLGYSNQIRGFYAQRLFGESFENYSGHRNLSGHQWSAVCTGCPPSSKAGISLTGDAPLHGLVAQRITVRAAGGD
jgi:hypothetical protein